MFGRRLRNLSKYEMEYRLRRVQILGPWYGRSLLMIASGVPIAVAMRLLQEFAGKETDLNVQIVASVSFVANVAMGLGLVVSEKARSRQRNELNRLRGRAEHLEQGAASMLGATKTRGRK